MLRPGVPEVSENIRVRSLVGRFLEHSRVFYFANGGKEGEDEVYISSADWMSRNLDRRVEVAVPILDPPIKNFLRDVLLDAYLRDEANARVLRADGTYHRVTHGKDPFDAQMFFIGTQVPPL